MSEILAPAGGEISAFAAINSGADAIYLGLDKFSARNSAENFDIQNFEKICKYAHSFGVKVYAALNTVVKNSELVSFINTAVSAWNTGADAIIIQDLFLGKFLKDNYPQIKLHLSTQAGTCNYLGAQLAKEYGFDRVILARETSLSDVAEIAKIIETEVFVQGALCTCFSGQCYMSSFAGGNSGNRGRCKQPCRKLYSIDREGFEDRAYRLSLSDICAGEKIVELVKAGAVSFKIEGRMRRPEYVAAAVRYYRNLLDGKTANISEIKRTYNRGNYTAGLAFGQDKGFISSAVQGHIGEFVGIIKVLNGRYICQTSSKFNRGDGFKILRGGKEVGGGAYGGEAKGGFIINTRDRLKNGDKVFITTDTALNQKLLEDKRLLPLKITAVFNAGKPPYAEVNGFKICGERQLEKAANRPVTQDEIRRCFNKVDNYPFQPYCEVITNGVFIAASVLNAFRRKVYASYYEEISKNKNAKINGVAALPLITTEPNAKTAVISTDLNGVKADIGILKPYDYSKDLTKQIIKFKGEKYLFVPPFLKGSEIDLIIKAAEPFDGIYCDGYFGMKLAEKIGKRFFAGTGFNIANAVSVSNCGALYLCLSKELTLTEANEITVSGGFYLSSGNIKVMDLIYCPFERKCASCDRRDEYVLTDGEGRKFPLRRYRTSECRFEVYNCANLVTDNSKAGQLCDLTLKTKVNNTTRGHSVSGIN